MQLVEGRRSGDYPADENLEAQFHALNDVGRVLDKVCRSMNLVLAMCCGGLCGMMIVSFSLAMDYYETCTKRIHRR